MSESENTEKASKPIGDDKKLASDGKKPAGNKNKLPDFERQLSELEKIVADMEQGEMTLEESLQAYERGVKLTRECQVALDSAQQRIDILTEKNGIAVEEPFNNES